MEQDVHRREILYSATQHGLEAEGNSISVISHDQEGVAREGRLVLSDAGWVIRTADMDVVLGNRDAVLGALSLKLVGDRPARNLVPSDNRGEKFIALLSDDVRADLAAYDVKERHFTFLPLESDDAAGSRIVLAGSETGRDFASVQLPPWTGGFVAGDGTVTLTFQRHNEPQVRVRLSDTYAEQEFRNLLRAQPDLLRQIAPNQLQDLRTLLGSERRPAPREVP